jgi:hypothetical protein
MNDNSIPKLALNLSPTQQVTFVIEIANLVLPALKKSRNFKFAEHALLTAKNWSAASDSPQVIEDLIQNEFDEGILICEQEALNVGERTAWLALASAFSFAAWRSYQIKNEMAGPLVSEIREDELDRLDLNLRNLPDINWDKIVSAAIQ